MPKVAQTRQMQHKNDDLLLGTFLDPSFQELAMENFDDEDDWNSDNFLPNSLKLHTEPNHNLSDSAWDAINAWLFDTQENLSEVKQEPVSPFNGSSSSFSSENEIEEFVVTTQTDGYLDPDAFLNQATHTSMFQNDHENISIQSDHGILQIVNGTVHQVATDLNETQLKVFQKFIPIKPKMEGQDGEERDPANRNLNAMRPVPAVADSIQIKTEGIDDKNNLQAKRKIKMENNPEQRLARKQKRMARNRESALQSRQKKKELMQTLEVRLNALSNMNSQLKNENDVLKDKIKQLENENLELKHKKQIDVPDLAKKTSCVLVLFVFLAINMKPLGNMSSKMQEPAQIYKAPIRHGRYLLEYDNKVATSEHPVYQNTVYNTDEARLPPSEAFMDILDRKVIRKIKRLYRLQGLVKREQLAAVGGEVAKNKVNETNDDCSLSFNKTEVFRLNEALDKLVKVHKKKGRKLKKKGDVKQSGKLSALKGLLKQPVNCTIERNNTSNCSRQVSPKMITSSKHHSRLKRSENRVQKSNEIQTFQYDWSAFERFQKSINRQPDTFYFVSFRKDHILLPPLQYNETQRPRVSFILPSSNSSHSIWNSTGDKVSLMQIDCQVMDTKIFHILKSNIPRYNLPFSSFFLKQT